MTTIYLLCSLFSFVLCNPFGYGSLLPGGYGYHGVHDGVELPEDLINEWTVQIYGGEEIAQLVALEFGYVYGGRMNGFPDTYIFYKYMHGKHRRTPGEHTMALVKDRRVRWAQQQFAKLRVKRYPLLDPDEPLSRYKRIDKEDYSEFDGTNNDGGRPVSLFNDELWEQEWYLQDTRTMSNLPRLHLNVLPVYEMGFNGSGVRVTVLDDGLEYKHMDLRDNYDPEISWDCNDKDPDPSPRPENLRDNSHGTRCAGEIAMTANNLKCGVGVAWGAKVGGIRMLDGRITDRIEAEAIAFALDKVDIYSASWGPNDDGKTVEGPGHLASKAFKRGIKEGRGGKGAIYVWANGNGGNNGDNCNCDGYSSNIYTISIGSASQHGLFPWYGEVCSSTLAAAYSSGAYKDQKIATTDTNNSCTLTHTGTSAAAPLAAGIIALALNANPNLTWRDVQHLIVWTSDYSPLAANPGWQINGAGLHFDKRFGFGLMNAGALVTKAMNWTTVPEKFICRVKTAASPGEDLLSSKDNVVILMAIDNYCKVNYIEHVQLIVNVRHSRRGAIEVYLVSPHGTTVQLLNARRKDASTSGFVNWPLMSVFTWGENPKGAWKAVFVDRTNEDNLGVVGAVTLVIHGTNEMPAHMKNISRISKNDYHNNYQYVKYNVTNNVDESDVIFVTDEVTANSPVAVALGEHEQQRVSNPFGTPEEWAELANQLRGTLMLEKSKHGF